MEPVGGMTEPEKMKAINDVSEEVKSAAVGKSDQLPSSNVDMKTYIGKQLQAVYDEILRQPVPDRFKDLLKKLDNKGNT
jgi:Anti-sigma factor NepR